MGCVNTIAAILFGLDRWQTLIAVGLLRQPGFALLNLVSVLANLAAFSVWLLVPYFLARVPGYRLAESGAILATAAAGAVLAAPIAGRILRAYFEGKGVIKKPVPQGAAADDEAEEADLDAVLLETIQKSLGLFVAPSGEQRRHLRVLHASRPS